MGEVKNSYNNILVRKSERKRPFGRPTSRWEENITMDVCKRVWEDVDWIHLTLDRDQWRIL
jgi:hypothetical protein